MSPANRHTETQSHKGDCLIAKCGEQNACININEHSVVFPEKLFLKNGLLVQAFTVINEQKY